jgi:NAD(P)-dependent dehydrogenase (short-subunit alcohol dehydrogenase family)
MSILYPETISSKATQCGLRASYHKCDVADDGQVIELFATVAKELRFPLTGIVTCAGIQQMIPVLEYPAAQFRRVLDINVTGTFLVAQEAAKLFRSQKVSGSIVMVSSMSGNIANKVKTFCAFQSHG